MKNSKNKTLPYKGSGGDLKVYASAFLEERLVGFDKDTNACLEGRPSPSGSGITHAYFPALMNCCGMLEFLGNLYKGNTENSGVSRAVEYAARYLDPKAYSEDNVFLLYVVMRHAAAHLGTLSGVRIPKSGKYQGKRITWKLYADARKPAILLIKDRGFLTEHPPWDCPHEYRLHVRLKRLQCDIRRSVLKKDGYLSNLLASNALMQNFEKCMHQIYPK